MSPSARRRLPGNLGKEAFAAIFAGFTALASFIVAFVVDPVQITTLTGTAVPVPAWYLAAAGIPFGILIAEAIIDYREYKLLSRRLAPAVMLVILGVLGSAGGVLGAQVSGHALIAAYFLLHQLADQREGRTWKLLVGTAVLLLTAWHKLFLWDDSATLLTGLGLGIFAWGVERTIVLVWVLRYRKQRT